MNQSSEDDDESHTGSDHEQHHLSCGMILPKRRRIGRYHRKHDSMFVVVKSRESCSSSCSSYLRQKSSRAQKKRHHRRISNQKPFAILSIPETFAVQRPDHKGEYCMVEKLPNICPSLPIARETIADTGRTSKVHKEGEELTPLFPILLRRFQHCSIELSNHIYSMAQAIALSANPHCVIEAVEPYRILHTNAALFTLFSSSTNVQWMRYIDCSNLSDSRSEAGIPRLANELFGSSFHSLHGYTTITMYPMCSSPIENRPRYYFLEIVTSFHSQTGVEDDIRWKELDFFAQKIVG